MALPVKLVQERRHGLTLKNVSQSEGGDVALLRKPSLRRVVGKAPALKSPPSRGRKVFALPRLL